MSLVLILNKNTNIKVEIEKPEIEKPETTNHFCPKLCSVIILLWVFEKFYWMNINFDNFDRLLLIWYLFLLGASAIWPPAYVYVHCLTVCYLGKRHTYWEKMVRNIILIIYWYIKLLASNWNQTYSIRLKMQDCLYLIQESLSSSVHISCKQNSYFKVILCASQHIFSIVRYCFRSFNQL
mgnify:CR=1 FL=1